MPYIVAQKRIHVFRLRFENNHFRTRLGCPKGSADPGVSAADDHHFRIHGFDDIGIIDRGFFPQPIEIRQIPRLHSRVFRDARSRTSLGARLR